MRHADDNSFRPNKTQLIAVFLLHRGHNNKPESESNLSLQLNNLTKQRYSNYFSDTLKALLCIGVCYKAITAVK